MYKLYKSDMDDYFNICQYYRYDFVYFLNTNIIYNDKKYALNNFIFYLEQILEKIKAI